MPFYSRRRASRDVPLQGIEETDELLMPVALHVLFEHFSGQHVGGREQRRYAVAFVIVGHGGTAPFFSGSSGLRPVEDLDLRLLVDTENQGMRRGTDLEPNDTVNLLDKGGAALFEVGTLTDAHFGDDPDAAKAWLTGDLVKVLENVAGHAAASDGNCGSGAIGAAVGGIAGPVILSQGAGLVAGTALTAASGALGAGLSGGDPALGAVTGVWGYLYNHVLGSNKPVGVTDDSGEPIRDADGKQILRPEGADPHIFINLAREYILIPGGVLAVLSAFAQGRPLDVQRNLGINYPEFVDYATICFGIYGAAAGISMDSLLTIQNEYAGNY